MGSQLSACVVIGVRDGERFLGQAIESVLGQTHRRLELRIYDNRSGDRSAAIARGYLGDPRVSYVLNDCDLGYYGSLNRGLAGTGCDAFVPFAADDVMAPANLERKLAAMDEAQAGLVFGPARRIDAAGDEFGMLGWGAEHRLFPAPAFFGQAAPINTVPCPSTLVRCDALRALGGFDVRVPYSADWLAWLRLSLRTTVAHVAEPLVSWRSHDGNGTSQGSRSATFARDVPATLQHAMRDPAFPERWHAIRAPFLAACLANCARALDAAGHRRLSAGPAAYELAARAALLQPEVPEFRSLFESLVRDAGLTPPSWPFDAVALDGEGSRALADRLRASGLLHRLSDGIERLEPGRVALCRHGSDAIAAAEQRGLPVLLDDPPDPFANGACAAFG
ncbi:MAG: hypothetical protein QOF08_2662 [Gaiellales bacterium]|jgi:hypothetical protein|nr:hypothetical protein [Gaiellales bacterium]